MHFQVFSVSFISVSLAFELYSVSVKNLRLTETLFFLHLDVLEMKKENQRLQNIISKLR